MKDSTQKERVEEFQKLYKKAVNKTGIQFQTSDPKVVRGMLVSVVNTVDVWETEKAKKEQEKLSTKKENNDNNSSN